LISSECYLAYAPRGAGLLSAVCYFALNENIYGWYIGAQSNSFPASFFIVERFYSMHAAAFYRTLENDIYGTWVLEFPPLQQSLDRPIPVPEDLCHELTQSQATFSHEWLFYRDDPGASDEITAFRQAQLPLQLVNIKSKKLNKLAHDEPVWTYASPNLDVNVIEYLRDNWPLDDRHDGPSASPAGIPQAERR
jgi:hypothetical protein